MLYDVIIIGAGPAGISASFEAARRKVNYVCLEAERIMSTIYNYPLKKTLFAVGKGFSIGSKPFQSQTAGAVYREEVLAYYEKVANDNHLKIRNYERVRDIYVKNLIFKINTEKTSYESRYIILATGMQACPRYLNIPGEQLLHVFHRLQDPTKFKGQKVLVVGGGNTAVEAALALNQNQAQVKLSYRKNAFFRLSDHNQKQIDEIHNLNTFPILYDSNLIEIGQKHVNIAIENEQITYPIDYVFILIGAEPSKPFLDKIGLQCDGVKPIYNPENFESTIPHLFVAGDLTKETLIHNAIRHGREIIEYITQNK